MNPRVLLAVGSVALAGAAKLISKLRDSGDEQEEKDEYISATETKDTKTTAEKDVQTQQSETKEEQESWQAHKRATNRRPPVSLGGVRKLGVEEIIPHHSGSQTARGKVEGFQIFVDDIPSSVRPLDIIRVKITSFGSGRTSAEAKFIEQV